ncbi:hypothetical protein GRAN_3130 [Granulicella sibirica]|uniref:Carboxypeptidase regulatory-like domain-containing protein n=2 Tax=Granulicella sibirica TaxID=2479048 RepID=A0A4Q0SYG0_9BACT|nr:hypothetical protein GRAN_3130 [Granulicella sibirica]
MGSRVYQFGAADPIVLTLYPEAILAGNVTDAGGEGLPNLNVIARRSTFDETGHHWRQVDATRTRSDGTFRLAMMAGDYSVQVRAMSQPQSGQEMYLPVSVPAESSSIKEAIHLRPGEVSEIHLTPETRKGYEVTFALGSGSRRGFPRLTARGNNGLTIPLSPRTSRSDQDTLSVVLPSGTYLLSGFSEMGGGSEEAETSITVPDHDIGGVELHFSKTPAMPVEVEMEQGATSDNATPPTAQSLGLTLVSIATNGDAIEQSFPANVQRDQTAIFSPPSGTYRLRGRSGGPWFVTQASCGGTDLLTQNLVVTPGTGSVPIRIVVSNQTGTLSGTVTLAGQPAPGWVYLVSATPSVTPVVMVRAGSSGSFSRSNLPVGTYRMVALERRIGADFEDPATMAAFLDRAQSVTLNAGGQQTLSLAAVPAAELPQ